jgi:transcriptional regulator with XRE-family HTH domain
MTLKLERVAADVAVKDVAAQMGISASRLSRIEDDPNLTERMVARYREALERCRTSGTSERVELTA